MRVQAAVTRGVAVLLALGLMTAAGCSTRHEAPSGTRVGGRLHLAGVLRDNLGTVTGVATLDSTDSAVVTLWRRGVPDQRVRTWHGGYEFLTQPGDSLRVGWGDGGDSSWTSTPWFSLAKDEARDLPDLVAPDPEASFLRPSIILYPNPVTRTTVCRFQLATGGAFELVIENLSGRVMYHTGFSIGLGGTVSVYVTLGAAGLDLATGNYWVRVLHDGRDALAPALLFVGYMPAHVTRPGPALAAPANGGVLAPPVFEWRARP